MLITIGLEIDDEERTSRHFGRSTEVAVQRLQRLSRLEETGATGPETVEVILAAWERCKPRATGDGSRRTSGRRALSGKVTDPDGLPLPAAVVVAFDCDIRTKKELGCAQTDSKGAYRIEYRSEDLLPDSPAADLKIDVQDQRGTTLFSSPVLFNAPAQATINAALGGAQHDAPSELSALLRGGVPLLGDLTRPRSPRTTSTRT